MPRLLFIQPGPLGATAAGLQLTQTVKRQLAGTRALWVASDRLAPLVRLCPEVDEVHSYRQEDGLLGLVRLLYSLGRSPLDAALDLHGSWTSAIIARLSPSQVRYGRGDHCWPVGFCYEKCTVAQNGQETAGTARALGFCRLLGIEERLYGSLVFRPQVDADPALADYRRLERPLLFFPCSRLERAAWKGWEELTESLLRAGRRPVVWVGEEERPSLPAWASYRFLNLTGRTRISSLPELLAGAWAVAGQAGGALPLAAAMGRTTLAAEPQRPPSAAMLERIRGLPGWED